MSLSSAIHKSDCKAARILGVTLVRDNPAVDIPQTRTSIIHVLRRRFQHRSDASKDQDGSEDVVWDVLNPFAPPDPALAHLHALIQADIARARRFESIAPHENDDEDEYFDSDDEDDATFDSGDDADADAEDNADNEDEDKPAPITLPRLLPIPLRFIPSPPPPPSPTPSSSDEGSPAPWTDLAQAYNNIAEAEERAARKAKRNAYRSRSKALAILGPEASVAL